MAAITHAKSPLADDVLGPGVEKIAAESPDSPRRVRHLIKCHGFPHVRIGGRFYSRRSWLNLYYSGEPVVINGGDKGGPK